jgi:hypothetical protein
MGVKMNIVLRKRTLSPVRLFLEDSSKRSSMPFVAFSLQLGSIILPYLTFMGATALFVYFVVKCALLYLPHEQNGITALEYATEGGRAFSFSFWPLDEGDLSVQVNGWVDCNQRGGKVAFLTKRVAIR